MRNTECGVRNEETSQNPRIIECREVTKIYGSGRAQTVALDELSLEVHAGEIVAVVGPSGSGKSTLLHLLGAMDTPDRGQVIVAGRNLATLNDSEESKFRREDIGFVFQFFNLIPTVNALDNVALPARLAGCSAEAAREKARRLLGRVDLEDQILAYPDALSGGQQQRLAIARALVNKPQILLADEPTGALDRRTGEAVLELLRELVADQHLTLVMATHSQDAKETAGRIVTVEDGRITGDESLRPRGR